MIQQPVATDLLSTPSHSKMHRVIGTDDSAPDKSVTVDSTGRVGVGLDNTQRAWLHIKGSSGAADQTPLKFTGGINVATPEQGAMEYDGTLLYFTPAAARHRVVTIQTVVNNGVYHSDSSGNPKNTAGFTFDGTTCVAQQFAASHSASQPYTYNFATNDLSKYVQTYHSGSGGQMTSNVGGLNFSAELGQNITTQNRLLQYNIFSTGTTPATSWFYGLADSSLGAGSYSVFSCTISKNQSVAATCNSYFSDISGNYCWGMHSNSSGDNDWNFVFGVHGTNSIGLIGVADTSATNACAKFYQAVTAANNVVEIRAGEHPLTGNNGTFTGNFLQCYIAGSSRGSISYSGVLTLTPDATKTVTLYHDGSNANLATNTGSLVITTAASSFVLLGNAIIFAPLSAGTCDLGAVGFEFANINISQKMAKYNNVTTAGWGIVAVYAAARSAAQTAAVASVATYTCGAADGTFVVNANVLVTTATAHSFSVQVTYTDEGNTSRTLTIPMVQLAGTIITAITNVTGAGPYEGVPVVIRVKASTAITVKTDGTFTTVTYNVDGSILQVA